MEFLLSLDWIASSFGATTAAVADPAEFPQPNQVIALELENGTTDIT